ADIKANGLNDDIILYDNMILDGRNRYRACLAAGWDRGDILKHCVTPIWDGFDPAAWVISANIHRRHLTAEQKRDLIAKLIKAQPEKSDRAIAKLAKTSDKTVATVRRAKEATAEIPQLKKRVGADGKARKQPTRKRPKKKAKPAAAVMADTKRELGDDLTEK